MNNQHITIRLDIKEVTIVEQKFCAPGVKIRLANGSSATHILTCSFHNALGLYVVK